MIEEHADPDGYITVVGDPSMPSHPLGPSVDATGTVLLLVPPPAKPLLIETGSHAWSLRAIGLWALSGRSVLYRA